MPKGVTNTTRFILTRTELNFLTEGGRRFDKPRVTRNNLESFKLANEDLRNIDTNNLIILELVSNG